MKAIDMYVDESIPTPCQERVADIMMVGMTYIPLGIETLLFTGKYNRECVLDSPIFRAMDINIQESSSSECVIDIDPASFYELSDTQVLHGILLCVAIHQLRTLASWMQFTATNPTLFEPNKALLELSERAVPVLMAGICDPLGVAAEQILRDTGSKCSSRPMNCSNCDHVATFYIAPGTSVDDAGPEAFQCPECNGTMRFSDDGRT